MDFVVGIRVQSYLFCSFEVCFNNIPIIYSVLRCRSIPLELKFNTLGCLCSINSVNSLQNKCSVSSKRKSGYTNTIYVTVYTVSYPSCKFPFLQKIYIYISVCSYVYLTLTLMTICPDITCLRIFSLCRSTACE